VAGLENHSRPGPAAGDPLRVTNTLPPGGAARVTLSHERRGRTVLPRSQVLGLSLARPLGGGGGALEGMMRAHLLEGQS